MCFDRIAPSTSCLWARVEKDCPETHRVLISRETYSYKIDYTQFLATARMALISLKILVGAARFELATPCAQGSLTTLAKVACNHVLTFQADPGIPVVSC
jgi:hypothetical protein